MQNHFSRQKSITAAGLVLVLGLILAVHPAEARKKFYAGGGPNSTSPSGDIDGQRFYSAGANGPNVYPGKLADGSGLSLMIGANIHPNLAVELAFNFSSHDSAHAYYPGEILPATYGAFLLGGRGILPLGDTLEVFARGMFGGAVLSYEKNNELPPNQARLESSFSGNVLGLGIGMRYNLDPIGIELSYMTQKVIFTELTAASHSGTVDDLEEQFKVINLTVMVNFGQDT